MCVHLFLKYIHFHLACFLFVRFSSNLISVVFIIKKRIEIRIFKNHENTDIIHIDNILVLVCFHSRACCILGVQLFGDDHIVLG